MRTSLESWLRGRGARLDTNVRALRDRDRGLECVRIEFGCLAELDELPAQHEAGLLVGDVVAVASNHQRLRRLVEVYDVPYVHIDWRADPEGATSAVGIATRRQNS